MLLAKVTFIPAKRTNFDEVERLAVEYLVALLRNGQICGEYFLARTKAGLVAFCHLARPDSVKPKFNSKYAAARYSELLKQLKGQPVWELLETSPQQRFSSWKTAPFLYCFTHAYDDESCICDGRNGDPVPVYLLPLSDSDREDLYCWSGDYADHDRIWLGPGELEMPAYHQMVNPTSALSRKGRELCARVEAATGIPTYYYVMKYYGRRRTEERRLCPVCKGAWLRQEPVSNGDEPFQHFHFRCDKCRLVSHFAADSYR
ncbi:MAG: Zn-ribbon-containing protein [Candidatus Sumerlaeaceae bacterium]|nr:Zn-ribbon-containing protein [Candidatus Sumerlaeaceae bacterium]